MKPRVLKYTITFVSDWHVGSGTGVPGSVDRRVVRHAEDGLPYVPGTTIGGIWRDACERVAAGLADGWPDWVPFLFGAETGNGAPAPCPKHATIRAARFPEVFRLALKGRPLIHDSVTHLVPGVRIALENGRALDDHLRLVEVARVGTHLEGTIELDRSLTSVQHEAAIALLRAGASWSDRLGGKRRRGWGRCRVSLVCCPLSDLQVAELLDKPGPPVPARQVRQWAAGASTRTSGASGDSWLCWNVEINALAPLVIADRQVGNLILTRGDIPGSMLLPVVLEAMRGTGTGGDGAARAGDLVVTDAIPLHDDGRPGRPAPRCLAGDKKAPGLNGHYFNLLLGPADAPHRAPVGAFVTPFTKGDKTLPEWFRSRTGATTHNVIDGPSQRPLAPGGLYTYRWIAPGARFRFQVRCRSTVASALNPEWSTDLMEYHRQIGRARRGEYGEVSLAVAKGTAPVPPVTEDGLLYVWLQGDLLLRDTRLRPTTSESALKLELERALEVRLSAHTPPSGTGHHLLAAARRESWSERWGLPRATLVGLAAGSVAVYQVDNYSSMSPKEKKRLAAAVKNVAAAGLGERRGEGFGQVSFNDPLVTNPVAGLASVQLRGAPPEPGPRLAPGSTGLGYAEVIERQAWRAEIARRTEADGPKLARELGFTSTKPGASQLGTLRMMAGAHLPRRLLDPVTRWLDHLKSGKRADAWEGSVENVEKLITDEQRVWELLELAGACEEPTVTVGGELRRRSELWGEAVQAVIVEAIRAALKADVESRTPEDGPNARRG